MSDHIYSGRRCLAAAAAAGQPLTDSARDFAAEPQRATYGIVLYHERDGLWAAYVRREPFEDVICSGVGGSAAIALAEAGAEIERGGS